MHDETYFSVYYMPYHFRVHVCVVEEGGELGMMVTPQEPAPYNFSLR
jgi:hypothetical protein